MALEQRVAGLFGLDDDGWARHANPASGWSRAITGLPAIILPAVSRIWIGWWAVPLALACIAWLILNPRLFAPPPDDSAWMTRAVLGERMWVERGETGLPEAQGGLPTLLNVVSGLGFLVMAYGLVVLDWRFIAVGSAVSWTAKMLFIDRTRAIYDRVAARDPSKAYKAPA